MLSGTPLRTIALAWLCAALLLLAGCNLSPVLSKRELVDWYVEYRPTMTNLEKFGYAGSDENYHYFITRPIDYFYSPRIPRGELHLPDERPSSQLPKGDFYFYLVDPGNDFKKVPDRWSNPAPATSPSPGTGTARIPAP